MPTKTYYYDFATITNYPELKGYLQDRLKELGDVTTFKAHEGLGSPYYSAILSFYLFATRITLRKSILLFRMC